MLRTHKLSERHANGAGSSRWSTISHLTPPHLCRSVARHALSCDTPNPTQHSTYGYCRQKRETRHKSVRRHNSHATKIRPDLDDLRMGHGFSRIERIFADQEKGSLSKAIRYGNASRPSPSIRVHPPNPRKSASYSSPTHRLAPPASSIEHLTTVACRLSPVATTVAQAASPTPTEKTTSDYCRQKRIRRHKDLRDRAQPSWKAQRTGRG